MFITASTLAVTLSLGVLGAKLQPRLPTSHGLELCPTALLVNTSAIAVGEHAIQHSIFVCPDDSISKAVPASAGGVDLSEAARSKSGNMHRSVAECTTAAPECQCGQLRSESCINITSSDPPIVNDCAILLNSLEVVAEQTSPTFITPVNSFGLLSFQTCALILVNQATTPIEICWDELHSNLGISFTDCVVEGSSSGAQARANNGLWLEQIFRSSP